jgi:hypothetical protein
MRRERLSAGTPSVDTVAAVAGEGGAAVSHLPAGVRASPFAASVSIAFAVHTVDAAAREH